MSRCPSCPVAGACVAEKPGWSFACRLAAGTDAERAFVVNRSAIDAGTFVVPPSPPPPPEAEPVVVADPFRPCCGVVVDLDAPAGARRVAMRAEPDRA